MKKLTIIVIALLLAQFTQAQTKLFTLDFEHGSAYITQTNNKETHVIQPVNGFYCDKNAAPPTFSFSSGNTNRVLMYTQISAVTFEGVSYTPASAIALSDSIESYLRRWSTSTDVKSSSGNTIEHLELTGTDIDLNPAGSIYGIHISGTSDAAYDVEIDGVTASYDHATSTIMPDINTISGGPIQSEINISLTSGSIIITKIK